MRAVETAVAANPAERCQTVGTLETALARAVVDGRETTTAWPRQRWMLVGSVAVASVIVAGATFALRPGLALEGMRDISIHPDGRQVVFNAGWRRNEQWVMENLLPR